MIIDGGDGTYWAFATNGNGANVQTLRSSDLLTWEQGPDALPKLAGWTAPGDVWAPEVAVHGPKRFVLYYSTRSPTPPCSVSPPPWPPTRTVPTRTRRDAP